MGRRDRLNPLAWQGDVSKEYTMSKARVIACPVLLTVIVLSAAVGDEPSRRAPREALQAFNDLIGSWRGTGEPNGTRAEKQRNFWVEKITWEWCFKKDDVHLR